MAAYLQQKFLLYDRIRSQNTVSTVFNLPRPSMRRPLRAHGLKEFSDLLIRALAVKQDEEDENHA